MRIDFYKIDESKLISYSYFIAQVSNHDLRELNSYKVRNILSIVFNTKIRDLLLEDLFNQDGTFLSNETKDNLFRYLSPEEKDDLKNHLSNYLDYQFGSSWYQHVRQNLKENSLNTIVIHSSLLKHESILDELKLLFPNKKISEWSSLNEATSALFLDYNHSWKKRNIFSIQEDNSKGIFLKHFFENVYKRKIYNDENQIYLSINSALRRQLFGNEILSGLKKNLDSLKPSDSSNEWDVLHESDDKNHYNPQEEIIIHYSLHRCNKFRINASFLLFKDENYSTVTSKNFILNPLKYEKSFEFSHLESIIDNIDLVELDKAIKKDESINLVIQPLWEKFNLNEKDGRLWKQLLKSKVQENGLLNTYNNIEIISGISQFVSLNTFENTYCNPFSDTVIPREKRVFKAICKYLGLPLEYRVAIHRERILIGGHSHELHMKLKPIIEAIVEYGVLNNHKSDNKLLEVLNEIIDKIEEKVDMDYFGFTRESLQYACIALCYEILDKMRLKPILKIEHITPN
jgi:hypothetical protein